MVCKLGRYTGGIFQINKRELASQCLTKRLCFQGELCMHIPVHMHTFIYHFLIGRLPGKFEKLSRSVLLESTQKHFAVRLFLSRLTQFLLQAIPRLSNLKHLCSREYESIQ